MIIIVLIIVKVNYAVMKSTHYRYRYI